MCVKKTIALKSAVGPQRSSPTRKISMCCLSDGVCPQSSQALRVKFMLLFFLFAVPAVWIRDRGRRRLQSGLGPRRVDRVARSAARRFAGMLESYSPVGTS